MDNNHVDDYVLVLEDRAEVKNEVEVGKLSVVSNIDEKGKLKTSPAEEAAIVLCEATYRSISRDIFSKTSDFFSETWDVFLDLYGIARKRSLKFVWGCAVGERWCDKCDSKKQPSWGKYACVRRCNKMLALCARKSGGLLGRGGV